MDTIAQLEDRLRHVEYAVHGNASDFQPSSTQPAISRLRTLEKGLASLAAKHPSVALILELQKKHPSIFNPSPFPDSTDLAPAALAQLVLAHYSLVASAAANLAQLESQSAVPDSQAFAKLVALSGRIADAMERQRRQMDEVSELRLRSARVVQKWYENGVLETGESWASWDERLKDVEIVVRRREAARRRDDQYE
ncbi:hypothetical protein K470DRAFT_23760 [Piedraia hortae CBS 480.64]|uniref:Nuclear distribution protein RO10 n=1 Tax=Piedraia hortae CBS 480.64 TaxID=1314780 RepID=A0A6A7C4Z5_9PEZI|nr:hypothetical protein K470DRAFT_23760 [Piedraia hortae CBS 480.64]